VETSSEPHFGWRSPRRERGVSLKPPSNKGRRHASSIPSVPGKAQTLGSPAIPPQPHDASVDQASSPGPRPGKRARREQVRAGSEAGIDDALITTLAHALLLE
jgi:hypothetical protein